MKTAQDELARKDFLLEEAREAHSGTDAELSQSEEALEQLYDDHRMELERTRKGMRTLERRLQRERAGFQAYRAHVQAAADATISDFIAGPPTSGGETAAGRASRRGRDRSASQGRGGGPSGRGGH